MGFASAWAAAISSPAVSTAAEPLNLGKKMEAYRQLEYRVVYQKYRAPEAPGTFHLAFVRKCSIHVSLEF
jgi:hypothetical protein